jgi:alpha-1,3-rhamnosyl/mannosyltransferase
VDQQYIPGLYAAATLTAYISFYEGFGMPVAESMASGTPVLTSNTASMPEVAAGSAAIIDPTDIHQISNKMEELLKNPELRKRMSEAGHERARIFTWKKAADILVQSLMKA